MTVQVTYKLLLSQISVKNKKKKEMPPNIKKYLFDSTLEALSKPSDFESLQKSK